MGSAPATISERLFMIEFARANTWGLTDTQKQQMVYVEDALNGLNGQLSSLMDEQFPAFKQALLAAGAPWIPQGRMQEQGSEPVEID
jgi:hypothetical protein